MLFCRWQVRETRNGISPSKRLWLSLESRGGCVTGTSGTSRYFDLPAGILGQVVYELSVRSSHLARSAGRFPGQEAKRVSGCRACGCGSIRGQWRRQLPEGKRLILGLLTNPDDDARYVAIKAVEDMRLTAASPQLVAILNDSKRRESERAAAVRALRVLGDKKAVAPIQAMLTGQHPATLKSVALQALAALDIGSARSAAEKLLDQPDPTLLSEAVTVLAATKAGAKLIGERFVAKKLPRDFFPQVTESLKNLPRTQQSPGCKRRHCEEPYWFPSNPVRLRKFAKWSRKKAMPREDGTCT